MVHPDELEDEPVQLTRKDYRKPTEWQPPWWYLAFWVAVGLAMVALALWDLP